MQLKQGFPGLHAGVVDQNVEPSKGLFGFGEQAVNFIGFGHVGLADRDVALGRQLFVARHLVTFVCIIQHRGGDEPVGGELAVALGGGFQKRHVGTLGIDHVALVGGLG